MTLLEIFSMRRVIEWNGVPLWSVHAATSFLFATIEGPAVPDDTQMPYDPFPLTQQGFVQSS